MALGSNIIVPGRSIVVTNVLYNTPSIGITGTGARMGSVLAYGNLVTGVNVYDIVMYRDKNAVTFLDENGGELVTVEYSDVLATSTPLL